MSRSFTYDLLSRVTSTCTPESGSSQTYYATSGGALCSGDPGTVCRTTDARSKTITYAYDTLNRLSGKTYSDSTPPVTFSYDQTSVTIGSWSSGTLANPKGRLTEAVTTSGGNVQTAVVYSYDRMGRPTSFWQCTPYNCGSASIWSMPFSYDLAGDITAWTHPGGFTITNTISAAQLITQISSSLADSSHPANMAQNITYTPWGALSSLTNGCVGSGCTNTKETYSYNTRLQTSQIQLGTTGNPAAYYTLGYNYSLPGGSQPPACPINPSGASGNNGNVIGYSYTDAVNSVMNHSALYVYDTLNRLACGQATGNSTYNLTYDYSRDGSGRYGNMTCTLNGSTNGLCPQYTFNAANNRITNSGYSYDAAGNLLADGTYGYTWDAEGRMSTLSGSGVTETNTYNALGQLVSRVTGGFTSHLIYDPAGQWTGEFNSTGGYWWGEYVRLGGRVVAFNSQSQGNTVFLHKDLLNTTHVVTGPSGSVLQDQIFYPWGQSKTSLGTWYQQEFGGLDYFDPADGTYRSLSRAYNPTPARWLSPDALGGDVSSPQSFNRYAYVLNNPASMTDPSGLSAEGACQTYWNFTGTWGANCNAGPNGGGGGGFDPDDMRAAGVCFSGGTPGCGVNKGDGFDGFLGGFGLEGLFGGPGGGVWSENPGIDIMHIPSMAGGLPCDWGNCSPSMPGGNGFEAAAAAGVTTLWGVVFQTTGWASAAMAGVAGGILAAGAAALPYDLYKGYQLAQAYGHFLPKATPVPSHVTAAGSVYDWNQFIKDLKACAEKFPIGSDAYELCTKRAKLKLDRARGKETVQ